MTRNNIKYFLKSNKCKIGQTIATKFLESIEKELIEISAANNAKFVKESLDTIQTSQGTFDQLGFWKLKQKLIPMAQDPPMAKHDKNGNIITSPAALKNI